MNGIAGASENKAQSVSSKASNADSIEQLRKRFVVDAKEAFKSFLGVQKRSRMVQVEPNPYLPDGDRLLVELEIPNVTVEIDGQTYSKQLSEEDGVLLTLSKFKRWKSFLLTKYFRSELKLTIPGDSGRSLQKIDEEKKEEELISETDPREQYPIKEEEKKDIEATRV